MPTICLTAAYSITASVNPPRATFVDLPLGNTAGRPHDPEFQSDLLRRAFAAAEAMDEAGTITDLGVAWDGDDSWK
ncbi:MAG: glycine reductase, partial [Acidimicrobiaceae bacterium]|nr:glycine reductase [Acidimicrobiaceae bacterium]